MKLFYTEHFHVCGYQYFWT